MGAIKNIIRQLDPLTKGFHLYNKTIFPYYHTVSSEALPHIKELYNYKTEKEFVKDLDFLLNKYQVLQPSDLIKSIQMRTKIPENSFLLSFDDGLTEVYKNIVPILNKKGIPAIFFINNKYIDNSTLFYKHKISLIVHSIKTNLKDKSIEKVKHILDLSQSNESELIAMIHKLDHHDGEKLDRILLALEIDQTEYLENKQPYLTFEELEKISNQGHFLGGHTVHHYPMDKLTINEQVESIIESVTWLKDNFHLKYELFSFPFSDLFASETLFEKVFSSLPNLICMGNSGMRDDISDNIIQRFSLEKENFADVGVRMNIAYRKYLTLIGQRKIIRKKL